MFKSIRKFVRESNRAQFEVLKNNKSGALQYFGFCIVALAVLAVIQDQIEESF